MTNLLDNVFWHAMVGFQSDIAAGSGSSRRYARGYSSIAAFADPLHADLDALAAEFDSGERFWSAATALLTTSTAGSVSVTTERPPSASSSASRAGQKPLRETSRRSLG